MGERQRTIQQFSLWRSQVLRAMMKQEKERSVFSLVFAELAHTYSILLNIENSLRDGDVEQNEQ
jgi:hypothetical protein